MTGVRATLISLSAAGWLIGAVHALAADPKMLDRFDAWSAHVYTDGGNRTCYLYATPRKSEGNYAKRDPTYVQVTHRTADGTRNEVSVVAGYDYKQDSEASIDIDGRKFALFTRKDAAWAYDSKNDAALVEAMKAGAAMIIRGTSSRGTLTTDSYSLKGFTAAYGAIGKACDIR